MATLQPPGEREQLAKLQHIKGIGKTNTKSNYRADRGSTGYYFVVLLLLLFFFFKKYGVEILQELVTTWPCPICNQRTRTTFFFPIPSIYLR